MKQITATFMHRYKTFNVASRKLPKRYAVVAMPHLMPAFGYLTDSYREDIPKLRDCNSYRIFRSLKQALKFVQNPYGHKGMEASEQLCEALEFHGVLEKAD